MAFLGLSFFFWAAPPPNQPHTPDMLDGLWVAEMNESCSRIGNVDGRGENCYRLVGRLLKCEMRRLRIPMAGYLDRG